MFFSRRSRLAAPIAPSEPRRSSDINVTPLIDVLLVLLIIFMAALPLSQRGQDVTLPQTSARQRRRLPQTRSSPTTPQTAG